MGSCFILDKQSCSLRMSNILEMRSGCSGWPLAQLWVIILLEYTYPTWYAFSRRVAGTEAARGFGPAEVRVGCFEEPACPSTCIPSSAGVASPFVCMLGLKEELKEGSFDRVL